MTGSLARTFKKSAVSLPASRGVCPLLHSQHRHAESALIQRIQVFVGLLEARFGEIREQPLRQQDAHLRRRRRADGQQGIHHKDPVRIPAGEVQQGLHGRTRDRLFHRYYFPRGLRLLVIRVEDVGKIILLVLQVVPRDVRAFALDPNQHPAGAQIGHACPDGGYGDAEARRQLRFAGEAIAGTPFRLGETVEDLPSYLLV